MNSETKQHLAEFLFKKEVFYSNSDSNLRIEKTQTPSVFGINYHKMVQPEVVAFIANALLMKSNPSPGISIAGINTGEIIAYEIAKISNANFVQVRPGKNGHLTLPEKTIKEIILVNDVIETGQNTSDYLQLILEAGIECKKIISVFDFGLNLTPRFLKEKLKEKIAGTEKKIMQFGSLLTIHDVIELADAGKLEGKINKAEFTIWTKGVQNLFRDEIMVA